MYLFEYTRQKFQKRRIKNQEIFISGNKNLGRKQKSRKEMPYPQYEYRDPMGNFVERTNPLNTSNYSNNTRTLYIWLIVITIVTFFVYLALNAFFIYLPISRIETKFDQTIEKLDDVADKVNRTAEKADKIIDNLEELGKVVVDEFDKIKGGICTWLTSEGINFPFCSEPKVVNLTMMSTQPRKPTKSCR